MLNSSNHCKQMLGVILASGMCLCNSYAMTAEAVTAPSGGSGETLKSPANSALVRPLSASQNLYFKRNWGVEVIGVHPVSSGYMLNFRYRVLDPLKAKSLNDMKSKAYVIDEASGTRLAVPAMEKVGELRSGAAPEADRTYFMIFGNPGRLVKPGAKISVVVGNFRAEGLVVN